MNNSLTKKSYYEDSQAFPAEHCVKLINPLSNDLSVMRQTLLFGGLESIERNRNRKNSDLRFYEFGNCYLFSADKGEDKKKILAGYSEASHIALWICGKRNRKNWAVPETDSSVFEMKAQIENILNRIGINLNQTFFEELKSEIYDSALSIRTHKRQLGSFGIISQKILQKFDIDTELFYAEMNWDNLLKESEKHRVIYSEISKFQPIYRDLALLVDKNITFAQIEQVARKSEKKLLTDITLFDVYEGKNLPENKKSYAVNFVLIDNDKTLTDKQIDSVMQKIISNLEKELGATLR